MFGKNHVEEGGLQDPKRFPASLAVKIFEHVETYFLFMRDNSCLNPPPPKTGIWSSFPCSLQHVRLKGDWEQNTLFIKFIIEKAGTVACFGNCRALLTGDILTTLDTWLSTFSHLLFPWSAEECSPGYHAHCWCICGNGRSFLSANKSTVANNLKLRSNICLHEL